MQRIPLDRVPANLSVRVSIGIPLDRVPANLPGRVSIGIPLPRVGSVFE